ncbi:MAG: translational GTPase TypA [Myxococcota bacterium]|nr:translational GTPase TypA [Myxococcota bacterium]
MRNQLRNIAIIAHVDHGKTTLVDHMLRQAGTFQEHQQVTERVMDSMDLERERGITILAKNTAVQYGDIKINIVDTPGHADFGGEVERVLKMVDGALLLVDASEGPLPQTRFVLGKALEAGLSIMVCINKIDRPDSRVSEVENEVYDLFIDLGADDEQLDFPILYACAKEGYCHTEHKVEDGDLKPLFDAIIENVPAPVGDPDGVPQFLVTQLGYDKYVGRLAVGRVFSGTIRKGAEMSQVMENEIVKVKVSKLFGYSGLSRTDVDEVRAGDICAIAGIADLNIGDTITSREDPKPLPRVRVEEPTIGVVFSANSGPMSGRDGKYVTGRQVRERLEQEALHNVAILLDDSDGRPDAIRVFGRGELQLAILMEQMRREGYEMCISKPEVMFKETEDGKKQEPYELATMDFPDEFMGVVSEKMNLRKGRMTEMKTMGSGRTRVVFRVPSRGLIGFRSEFLNDSRGQGIMNTLFDGWDVYAGHITFRANGSLVADRKGQTTAYALFHLQPRGKLFLGVGEDLYEGMIVGENSRNNDMNVNACRSKALTNFRSSGADEKLILAPPVQITLEKAMEFIAEDELIEVTPNHIRLRKKVLQGNLRSVVRGPKKTKKK